MPHPTMSNLLWKWAALVALVVAAGILISSWDRVTEYFEDAGAIGSLEDQIVDMYASILKRQPSSTELIDNTRAITAGTMTMKGLRQRLYDSEEYSQMIKLQSNELAPELDKVLSDREIFKTIQDAYKSALKKDLPGTLLLPLRDIYIALEYNVYTFKAFLLHKAFPNFEKDLLNMSDIDKESMMALFTKTFSVKDLVAEGLKIKAAEEAALAANSQAPKGASPLDKVARTTKDEDTDVTAILTRILQGTNGVLDKDAQARILDEIQKIQDNPNMTPAEKRQAIAAILSLANQDAVLKATADAIAASREDTDYINVPTHEGDMVLRPEFAWSVPQRRPPVCTTLSQPALVQPQFTNSHLLLGTPLNEAKTQTAVGSIMPKFQYQNYADVGINIRKQKCADGNADANAKATPKVEAKPAAPAPKTT